VQQLPEIFHHGGLTGDACISASEACLVINRGRVMMRFISLNCVDNSGWYLHHGADIGLG
jgi:hypothetical protein